MHAHIAIYIYMQQYLCSTTLSLRFQTGARVISSETVPLKKGINFQFDPNNCLTVNSKAAQQELFVLRVYLDGYYTEPPPEVLPPAPVVGPPASLGCCTVL